MPQLRILYSGDRKDIALSVLANAAVVISNIPLVEHIAGAFEPDNVPLPLSQYTDHTGKTETTHGTEAVAGFLVSLYMDEMLRYLGHAV